MFCSKCGTDNSDDYKFCMMCGVPLTGIGDESNRKGGSKSSFVNGVLGGILIIALAFVGYIIYLGFSRESSKSALYSKTSEESGNKVLNKEDLKNRVIDKVKNRYLIHKKATVGESLKTEVIPDMLASKDSYDIGWNVEWDSGSDIVFVSFTVFGYIDHRYGSNTYKWIVNLKEDTVTPNNKLTQKFEEDQIVYTKSGKYDKDEEQKAFIKRKKSSSYSALKYKTNYHGNSESVERLPTQRQYERGQNSVIRISDKNYYLEAIDFYLKGVIEQGGYKKAIINIGFKNVAVGLGDEIYKGWRVTVITDDFVTIQKGDEMIVLRLQY